MELELRDYLRILRKRRLFVAVALVACLAGAGALTAFATPVYEAEAKLFVGQRQIAAAEIATGQTVTQLSFQLLRSYAQILRTRPIAERAVEREGLPISPTRLSQQIRAEPILDTQLIRLRYRSTDPDLAQRAVNSVAQTFIEEIERIENVAADDVAVKVENVEPALRPEGQVSPRPLRNVALGLMLGLMVGPAIAFLVEYLDVTVKRREDVEALLDVAVLGTVPRIDTLGQDVYLERDPQSMGAESFRKLRTTLQFLTVDHPLRTILVTSPFSREGKTTTALNLAAVFAQAGLQTVLVEADLRRPSLHLLFPTDGQRGLTTALIGKVPLTYAVLPTHVRNLSHMPAGALPPNPVELLASGQMNEILDELSQRFDVVLIDSPPILPVADASVLAPHVDGVVVVARSGQTHRDRLRDTVAQLHSVGGRVLGVVLTFDRSGGESYGYEYYGYRAAAPAGPSPFETNHEVAASPVRAPDAGAKAPGAESRS